MTENERLAIRWKQLKGIELTPEELAMLKNAPLPNAQRTEEQEKEESEHWEPSILKAAAWLKIDRKNLSTFISRRKIEKGPLGYECISLRAAYRAEHPERGTGRSNTAKERREEALADIAELTALEKKRAVVKIAEVQAWQSYIGNKINDELQKLFLEIRNEGGVLTPAQWDIWSQNRLNVFNALMREHFEKYAEQERKKIC